MITPYVLVALWILSGGIAWKVATNRQGSRTFWALFGQVFGPFAIPFAYLTNPQS